MADGKEILRVSDQKTAAHQLGVTARRLRQMESEAPWWRSELRTPEGYDVCGIVAAQLTHSGIGSDSDLRERREVAETERVEFQREAERLKVWQLERAKREALGNILPADVYQSFLRELLGMIGERLDEIPYRLSRQASPGQKKFVYVPESKIKKPADASPLQREIAKLRHDIQTWLDAADDEVRQGG